MLNLINNTLTWISNIPDTSYQLLVFLTAETAQVDFIGDLYKLSPIIGLLLVAITYLVVVLNKKEKLMKDKDIELNRLIKEKDDQLKELNQYVRQSEKDNLLTLQKVSSTLDRVIDSQKTGDNIVLKEIDNLKDIILLKLKKEKY
jgi:hypothetical protein